MKTVKRIGQGMMLVFLGLVMSTGAWATQPKKPLKIDKIHARSSKEGVKLCVEMNAYLSDYTTRDMKPHITLDPPTLFGVEVNYDEVCAVHLLPRTTYTMKVDRRIPLGEDRLDKTYTFTKRTGDIDPSIRAKGRGYVLPARGEITLPFESTNVTHAAVSLYRVNTRNLIHSINDYSLLRKMSGYDLYKLASEEGERVWEKRLTIDSRPNQKRVTAVPVGSALKQHEPGVYILELKRIDSQGHEHRYHEAMQWFMISDIGLTSTQGSDGLRVNARHLSDATPYRDIRYELIAANNQILGHATSSDGYVFFKAALLRGKRGLKPRAVYAYGKDGDFSVLDLSRAPFDLSDRGVSGREALKAINALLFSNRGIFRPGETVPFRALVRDDQVQPISGRTLSAKLYNTRQELVATQRMTTDASGYLHGTFPIAESAATGNWRIELYAGEAQPFATLNFLVEDFVPPTIALEVTHAPDRLQKVEEAHIRVRARFLTGEALSKAPVELSAVLHAAKKPFADYPGYRFGDFREKDRSVILANAHALTDDNGTATLTFTPKSTARTSLPLAIHVELSAHEPGGRPVSRYVDLFYDDKDAYLGIKPRFEGESVDVSETARFDLVALQHGKPVARTLRYRLIREETEWDWRSQDGGSEWEYYRTYRDQEEVTHGTIALAAHPTPLTLDPLTWGSYRLEVEDDRGDVSTFRFTSGYEESVSRASPDRLPVVIDKQHYRPGESVRVRITPKFSGPVTVSMANHRILATQIAHAKAGEPLELSFPTDPKWGGSVWVLATAYRAQSAKLGASRAIGVAHVSIEDPARRIALRLEAPKRIASRRTLTLKMHARTSGDPSHKVLPIHVSVAAVDEGVLGLTRYGTPDPVDFFFGKRRLGVGIRDLYGDLITPAGAHGQFDVGAGDDGGEDNPLKEHVVASHRRVVALWNEAVACDANGTATVTFDVPDFQGALRLMAVAWSDTALGSAQKHVIVKDPISAELYLPTFMSSGDRAQSLARVSIDPTMPEGNYSVELHAQKGLSVHPTHWTIFHRQGHADTDQHPITLEAGSLPEGSIRLTVQGEGNITTVRDWSLGIRSRYPESYVHLTGLLESGAALSYASIIHPDQWAHTRHLRLRLSGAPLLATDAYRQELIDYTGRCAEQTTSRAFPALDRPRAQQSSQAQTLVQKAIARLLSLQRFSGGFGLWGSNDPDLWVSAYAMDFLTRAQEQGYALPKRAVTSGLHWLERNIDRWAATNRDEAKNAYALYVLARTGHTLITPMRTLTKSKNLHSAEGWAHLAAAFAHVGESKEAKPLFAQAKKALGNTGAESWLNYGGRLRDMAVLVTMLAESDRRADAIPLYADLARGARDRRWLSTQEMSTLLRAADRIAIQPSALKLQVNGKTLHPKQTWQTQGTRIVDLPKVVNQGAGALWYDVSFIGTPSPAFYQASSNHGFAIEKHIYTLKGTPVPLDAITQRSRLIIVLRGRIESPLIRHPLITDWVPAGFELENPDLTHNDITDNLKWLGAKTPTAHTAWRADRFEAALLPQENNNTFVAAYAVRAVTRGTFALPPVRIVDMYRPYYRAFGSVTAETLTVRNPQTIAPSTPTPEANTTVGTPTPLTEQDYMAAATRSLGRLDRYTITQLNYLRNSIFARGGLDFSRTNPMLDRLFKPFSWYTRTTQNSGAVYAKLTPLQRGNVQKLLTEEKRRGGGLSLTDFYRVRNTPLTPALLAKYDKRSLRILRNSLIARHGYRFSDPELSRIFSAMPWYHPTDIDTSTVLDEKMSPLERANIQQLLHAEHAR